MTTRGLGSRTLLAALAVVVLVVSGWWAASFGLADSVQSVEERIRSWGAWGVAGSIALMVAHSFLPFPSEIVALANGMVYGPLWGAVITWVGAMLGASAAFGLVRALGRPLVMRLLSPRSERALEHWSIRQGGPSLLVARLIPVIAFNLINYAAALTHISWWTFLWATGLGILPLTILLAVLGDNVLDMPAWIWLVVVAVSMLAWLALRHWRSTREKN
jgi:uncharacterized membrane protein YdjX (TVP38/TMEM64 family)